MSNPLLAIKALGQSIWLDNISRELSMRARSPA